MMISVVHHRNVLFSSTKIMCFFVPGERTEVDKTADKDSDTKNKLDKDSANL